MDDDKKTLSDKKVDISTKEITNATAQQELYTILNSFGPLNTPGPDGFPIIFF